MKIKGQQTFPLQLPLGLITGVFATMSMIFQGIMQIIFIVLLCLCLAASVLYVRKLPKKSRAVLLYIVLLVAGYLLSCAYVGAFLGRVDTGDITPVEKKEETAILLLSPGELTEYHYRDALYRLRVYRETGFGGVRWWNIPIKAQQLKNNLNKMERNTYTQINQNLYHKLEQSLGDRFKFYNASLFGAPFIETAVSQILNDGYQKIIILNNFLVEQPYKEVVDNKILKVIEKSRVDAEVKFTFPLWNHDGLISYYEQCILEKTQEISPEQIGVVLVARGTGRKSQRKFPKTLNREEVFYNKIKESIVKNGFESRKIRIAYLRHRRPGLKDAIDYLLDYGISKLVIVTAGFENPGIDTEYHIPRMIEGLDLPGGVDAVVIGTWGDSDFLVRALIDRLEMVDEL